MATLVLTTVGGLVGGPIGAALGGLAGQAVDRNVLFKPKGRQGPRLTELAVQTSRYGQPIPRLFGRMRVAGQVIWATDLVEHRGRQGGGKGQPNITTYAYSASFAVALSARVIRGVGRIWADGNLLRGAAGDWKVATGFRLHLGGEDQAVDPLIASVEGVGLAPAHRGVAYAVFEDLPLETFGNRIPSLTFEVIADDDAVLVGLIAREIADRVLVGAGPAMPLAGFSAYGDSARGVIETLAEVSGAWFAPVAGGLAMLADATPTRTLRDEGRMRRIAPAARVPRSLVVSHYDPERDWQTGVQRAARPGTDGAALAVELPAALSADGAKATATAMLTRAEAGRTTRRISADATAIDVVPGMVVSIDGEGGAWRVSAVSIERFGVTIDMVALAPPTLAARASPGRVLRPPDAPSGGTIVHAFETPALIEDGSGLPRVTIVAAGTAAGWRRAALQYSVDDGNSWVPAGGTAAPGIVGTLAAPLAAGPTTLADMRNAIHVVLAHEGMMLANADAGALDRGANLALVGDELLQFGAAEPLGGAAWRLTRLWRGRRGSAALPNAAGTRFVLLDGDSALALAVDAEIGSRIRIMASGVGDPAPVEADVVLTGASVLPPAPVRLLCRVADGVLTLGWRRRSRMDWRWRDGVDAALGEEREAYRVTITSAAGTQLIETAEPRAAITFNAGEDTPMAIAVRQIGSHGLSPAATLAMGGD
ncbi:GTA baseplate fiber-binding domain-containing protein [Sphingomonas jeddahensis]|uniref:Uncharacterized protein n=1 Tax=Sphingomonas jeddahensis TaxID=1915074 RepID=A0A1V2EQJ3_9SPHN|nr:phage tail protein [Sphingomonas jeddahensis]ONF94951.1 hypothetical protein SPHI_28900 [Sphingomonas jeddahensis]